MGPAQPRAWLFGAACASGQRPCWSLWSEAHWRVTALVPGLAARRLRPSDHTVHATAWWRAPGGCDSKAERTPAPEWAGATWVAGSLAGARLGQTSRAMTVPVPRPGVRAPGDDHMMLPLIPKLRSKHRHLWARATEIQVGVPTEVPGPLPSAMQSMFS